MIFWKKNHSKPPSEPIYAQIEAVVDQHMPDADEVTVRVVTSVAGLLAAVAYADRQYAPEERSHVREALQAVHGLLPQGVDTIAALLDERIVELASANPQAFTRDLRELAAVDTRREILQVLVDLAAADGRITTDETNLLRRTTTAMGLEDDDYVEAQSQYRDRLSVLNPDAD